MKFLKLPLVLLLLIVSCNKNDTELITEKETSLEVLEFFTVEELEEKEIEYRSLRNEVYSDLSKDFLNEIDDMQLAYEKSSAEAKKTYEKSVAEENFLAVLNDFHSNRLAKIYELRKTINFVSIQSIVDEINSLKLNSPEKSEALYKKYSKNITYNDGIAVVENYIANPNITNANGVLLFDGYDVNLLTKEEESNDNIISTKTPVFDSENANIVSGGTYVSGYAIAEISLFGQQLKTSVYWGAGRNSTNYVLWTRSTPYTYYISTFKKYNSSTNSYETLEVPARFVPNSGSNCGFWYERFLAADFDWVDFPSDYGTSVYNYGSTRTGKMYVAGSVDPSGVSSFSYSFGPIPVLSVSIDVERFFLDEYIDYVD